MNLHRADGYEWAAVPLKDRNVWQQLAARSRGYVTPGNIITLIGLILFVCGLVLVGKNHVVTGVIVLLIGRAADLLDGYIANLTATKSPLGEAFDAVVDKFEAGLAIILLSAYGRLPLLAAIILAMHSLLNAVLSVMAMKNGRRLRVTASGKLATAGAWIVVAVFVLSFSLIGRLLLVIFTVVAIISLWSYVKQYRQLTHA